MKKKIIAIVLSVILCFSMSVPAFALSLDDIMGAIGGGSTGSEDGDSATSDIMNEIINAVISSDGVIDITNIVMEIVAKVTSGDIQQGGKDLLIGVIQSTIDSVGEMIKQMYENKDLVIIYDQSVIENLFDVDLGEDPTKPPEETTTDPDEMTIGMGDVDGDGKITSADARLILRRAALLISFTDEQNRLADVDGDGKVTSKDARIVLRVAAGLETLEEK